MTGRHEEFRRIVEETVFLQIERLIARPVRQRFAPALDADGAAILQIDEILYALTADRSAIDDKLTVPHLDAVARQADHPFDVADCIVLRQAEHHGIATLRSGAEDPAREEPRRERQRIVGI